MDEFVCAQYTFVNCVIGFEFWNPTQGVELGIFCNSFIVFWELGNLRYLMAALNCSSKKQFFREDPSHSAS